MKNIDMGAKAVEYNSSEIDGLFQMLQMKRAAEREQIRKNDSSLSAGKAMLKGVDNNNLDKPFIKSLVSTDQNTLKLSGMALLLKHLEKGVDTSNCLIIQEPQIMDNDNVRLPNLDKIIKYALSNNHDLNIIYRMVSGHDNLISFRVTENKKLFYVVDSLGIKGESFNIFEETFIQTIKDSKHSDNTYIVAGTEQRQFDKDTCSIFVYKDLKTILSKPDLLKQIIESSGDLKSVGQQCDNFNYFEKFPVEMLKLTQSVSSIESDGRGELNIKDNLTLSEYIAKGKNKYGVTSPAIVEKGPGIQGQGKIHNKISEYFKQKYIQATIPEMLKDHHPLEIINILDQYDSSKFLVGDVMNISEEGM